MIVSPSRLKSNKIYKGRTLNFETVRRTHDNLIVIPAKDRDQFAQVLGSKLFRPQQIIASYTPRTFKVMDMKVQRVIQKEFYKEMRDKTNGRIKYGKIAVNAYGDRNIAYNISDLFSATAEYAGERRKGLSLSNYLTSYLFDLVDKTVDEVGYTHNYLVIPITEPIEKLRAKTVADYSNNDPVVLFLRALRRETLPKELIDKFDGIFFYNPEEELLYKFDPERMDNFMFTFNRVSKLNRITGVELEEDPIESDEEEIEIVVDDSDMDEEDKRENTKEQIKKKVLDNISRQIKAPRLDDYQATSKDEQDIIQTIDKKVEEFIDSPESTDKTFEDLTKEIEEDKMVRTTAIRYLETKKSC